MPKPVGGFEDAPHVTLVFGEVRMQIASGYSMTTFPDGVVLVARHDDVAQLGQASTAHALGYASVEAMNRDHDLLHLLLAHWLGQTTSGTLDAVAHDTVYPHVALEEAAVLAIQALCVAVGIDPLDLARRICDGG
jgi:hypothetical protein